MSGMTKEKLTLSRLMPRLNNSMQGPLITDGRNSSWTSPASGRKALQARFQTVAVK